MANKKSNKAGDKSNLQESLLEGIADDIDFAVPENEVAETILAVDIDADVNCSSIEFFFLMLLFLRLFVMIKVTTTS